MRAMERVPDWENDPIEVICAPVSGRLLTRALVRDDLAFLRKIIAADWRRKRGLKRSYDGTFAKA